MSNDDDQMRDEYALSTEFLDEGGGPLRCVTAAVRHHNNPSASRSFSPSLELLAGSEGGVVSRVVLPSSPCDKKRNGNDGGNGSGDGDNEQSLLEIRMGGANARHPDQITAILSSTSCSNGVAVGPAMGNVYVTGCKDGNVRVMDGENHELKYVMRGHSDAVTSLSWIPSHGGGDDDAPWLASGSRDGTAKLWSISRNSHRLLGTLDGHENAVSVAGLPAELGAVRRIATVSAGAAAAAAAEVEGYNSVRGHAVRIWRLTSSSDGSRVKSKLMALVADDHGGPIRDVVYDLDTRGLYTCSDDGTVRIRSADDGRCRATLARPGPGRPPALLSLCVVGDEENRAVVAGAEDGGVVVWNLAQRGLDGTNRGARAIAHPGRVWNVAAIRPGSSDFVTACDDGRLRVFARRRRASEGTAAPSSASPRPGLACYGTPASEFSVELAGIDRGLPVGIRSSAMKSKRTSRSAARSSSPSVFAFGTPATEFSGELAGIDRGLPVGIKSSAAKSKRAYRSASRSSSPSVFAFGTSSSEFSVESAGIDGGLPVGIRSSAAKSKRASRSAPPPASPSVVACGTPASKFSGGSAGMDRGLPVGIKLSATKSKRASRSAPPSASPSVVAYGTPASNSSEGSAGIDRGLPVGIKPSGTKSKRASRAASPSVFAYGTSASEFSGESAGIDRELPVGIKSSAMKSKHASRAAPPSASPSVDACGTSASEFSGELAGTDRGLPLGIKSSAMKSEHASRAAPPSASPSVVACGTPASKFLGESSGTDRGLPVGIKSSAMKSKRTSRAAPPSASPSVVACGTPACKFSGGSSARIDREPPLVAKSSSAKKGYGTRRSKGNQEVGVEEDITVVALGGRGCRGDASTAQDIGNYRMLIDDLSYLCSAIIHCRSKQDQHDQRSASVICKHSPITAGASCDIAELISQPDTRSALLIVSAQTSKNANGENGGARVGALEAVLESIACAPPVLDLSELCRKLIDRPSCLFRVETGNQQNQDGGSSKENVENELDFEPSGDAPPRISKRKLNPSENVRSKPVAKSAYVGGEASSGDSGKHDAISSKALSIVSYFVGIDCTGSDRAAIRSKNRSNRFLVQSARKSLLQHKSALQGIARLVSYDPVVHAYLREANDAPACDDTSTDEALASKASTTDETLDERPSEKLASSMTPSDPTKMGRRGRKRKPSPRDLKSHHLQLNNPSRQSLPLIDEKFPDKSSSLEFFSPIEGGTPFRNHKQPELNSGGKYEEKIASALSRAKLTSLKADSIFLPQRDFLKDCRIWEPHVISFPDEKHEPGGTVSTSSLAIVAADCIISGRDRYAEDTTPDNGEDSCEQDGLMSKNPIVYANEMLRQSGSLPHYSRAMSETLVAILLASKPTTAKSDGNHDRCSVYLQHRATLLSEVIDNLCCLSPKVSMNLSLDKLYLVPSLLRVIAELTFAVEDSNSSLICESTTTALNTLTTLTHENSVACEQIIRSYFWKIPLPSSSQGSTSSSQITGLDIVFSYLFKAASMNPESKCAHHKSNYDNIIFCLNILTNIVEMVPDPTKNMIDTIVVKKSIMRPYSSMRIPGLTWLVRWVVSKTSGFQNSVMKGSFGSAAETNAATDAGELKAGEESNLVTSGNGFVLLAYLMMDDENFASKSIRDSIIKELPVDSDGNCGGIQFMIKTLKAFCNFYHYSVGDLSVAVIAPVVKLISGLEKIDLAEQQAACPESIDDFEHG